MELFFLFLYKNYVLGIISQNQSGYQVNNFLISSQNIWCRYSLEAPRWGASNEYPQQIFLWRNKKNINTEKKKKNRKKKNQKKKQKQKTNILRRAMDRIH